MVDHPKSHRKIFSPYGDCNLENNKFLAMVMVMVQNVQDNWHRIVMEEKTSPKPSCRFCTTVLVKLNFLLNLKWKAWNTRNWIHLDPTFPRYILIEHWSVCIQQFYHPYFRLFQLVHSTSYKKPPWLKTWGPFSLTCSINGPSENLDRFSSVRPARPCFAHFWRSGAPCSSIQKFGHL